MNIQSDDKGFKITFPQTFILVLVLILGGMYIAGGKIEIGPICFPVDKCTKPPVTPATPNQPSFGDLTLAAIQATQTKIAQLSSDPSFTPTIDTSAAQTLVAISATQTALSNRPIITSTTNILTTQTMQAIGATQTAMSLSAAVGIPVSSTTSVCTQTLSVSDVPLGTALTLTVQPGTFDLWTVGDIKVNGVNFPGGESRGNVIVMLPTQNKATTYSLTGLIPKQSWHGSYTGCTDSDQQNWISRKILEMQTSNCVNGGCQTVEVGIFDGGHVQRYIAPKQPN